ncbi:MAG: zf-HC2 domain-containing protein [Candidatus Latescibacterota bacterium]
MKCEKVQRTLSAFLDGEVSRKQALEISEHVAGCPPCQLEAESLSAVWVQLGEMPAMDPTPFFWTRLNARITQVERRSFSLDTVLGFLGRLVVPATVVAASVVGLWIGGTLYDARGGDQPEVWEQVTASLYLDALDDFPAHSIGSDYVQLLSD